MRNATIGMLPGSLYYLSSWSTALSLNLDFCLSSWHYPRDPPTAPREAALLPKWFGQWEQPTTKAGGKLAAFTKGSKAALLSQNPHQPTGKGRQSTTSNSSPDSDSLTKYLSRYLITDSCQPSVLLFWFFSF